MMLRKLQIVSTLILLLALAARPARAEGRLSLKLRGGFACLQTGDVNPGTRAYYDWGILYFTNLFDGLTAKGQYHPIHLGYEFGGDIIFALTPKIGVGLGLGYLKASKNTDSPMVTIDYDSYPIYELYSDIELRAIPLQLNVFLTLPTDSKTNFIANAGTSWFFDAKYTAGWRANEILGGMPETRSQIFSTVAEKTKWPVGFQGGIGIEHFFFKKAALFVEAQAQYARFRHFKGTTLCEQGIFGGFIAPFSEQGELYYETVAKIPGSPRLIIVQTSPSVGTGGVSRGAVVDFSGIRLQAGIRIHI